MHKYSVMLVITEGCLEVMLYSYVCYKEKSLHVKNRYFVLLSVWYFIWYFIISLLVFRSTIR